ncbi:subtilisin-like serine peptidase [Trypanosoma conorhini]|uniref:Subtilisin-like serine peptidase n=1 Tax=Trypanosoma conorhini TaxID=83891 RepID=A0A3R7NG16_9TRYP|nr:subtilisin-like serine peptidase [Trypanosoma conorhini]RNF21628.1 subtilisin-like serine peptidase [Trypanosoma conorhini]
MLVCRWMIVAPRGRRVRLEYLSFDVESPMDVVLLYNDATEETGPARADTGTSAKGVVFFSASNVLSVVFSSQWSHVRRGFLLRYGFEKSTHPNCSVSCVATAFCDAWGGGFCVCDEGRAGWDCGVAVDANKKALELREGEKGAAARVTLLVNEELQLALRHSSSRWRRADVYLAFEKGLFTRRRDGMALRAAVLYGNPGGMLSTTSEEKIEVKSDCRYARISIGRTLSDQDGGLNISFTLLYSASLASVTGDSAKYLAAAYLAPSESWVAQEENDKDALPLRVYCTRSLPSTVPSSVFGDLSPSPRGGSAGSLHTFIGLTLFVCVVCLSAGLCVALSCCPRVPSEDFALAEIPAEEVAVLASPDGGGEEELGDNFSLDSAEELLSPVPPVLLAREAREARPQEPQEVRHAYAEVPVEDVSEVEMVEASQAHEQGEKI